MITVDFDNKEEDDLKLLFFYLRLKYICRDQKIDCKIRKTYKGFHVYIDRNEDFLKELPLRAYLFDDPNRIEFDFKRYYGKNKRWIDTLFKRKKDRNYEYLEEIIELD